MNGGHAAEVGRPLDLMLSETSLFRKMCQASGDFDNLLKIASNASHDNIAMMPLK